VRVSRILLGWPGEHDLGFGAPGYRRLVLREANELSGRLLMRDGVWLPLDA
jgi:hypothetical protein